MENMLDKLIITALRGKIAAVLFKDGHAAQIDFEPEAAILFLVLDAFLLALFGAGALRYATNQKIQVERP